MSGLLFDLLSLYGKLGLRDAHDAELPSLPRIQRKLVTDALRPSKISVSVNSCDVVGLKILGRIVG